VRLDHGEVDVDVERPVEVVREDVDDDVADDVAQLRVRQPGLSRCREVLSLTPPLVASTARASARIAALCGSPESKWRARWISSSSSRATLVAR
jgi:hypothetical protein